MLLWWLWNDLDLAQIQLLAPLVLQGGRQAPLPRHPPLPGLLGRRWLRPAGRALWAHRHGESGGERLKHRVRIARGGAARERVLLRPDQGHAVVPRSSRSAHRRRLHVCRSRRRGERLAAHDHAARAAALLERVRPGSSSSSTSRVRVDRRLRLAAVGRWGREGGLLVGHRPGCAFRSGGRELVAGVGARAWELVVVVVAAMWARR